MKTINGQELKQLLLSAANNLYNHYPDIDALNVFPVPDGDTGMNMNLTLASGAKEIQNRNDLSCYDIALAFAKGLLMGARGNSGVITSQIFRGFARGLEGKKTINAIDLANAFDNGREIAYKAVMRPVEGTILTVIRESSEALKKFATKDTEIPKALEFILNAARKSLARTPDLLPILKEVGVVDSGGSGLVTILEGMHKASIKKFVSKKEATSITSTQEKPSISSFKDDEEFGYCTEFIMRLGPTEKKKPFIEDTFKSHLQARGNSIVLVRDEDIVKVHIHTLTPGLIINYAQQFGEFVTVKVENMTEQHTNLQDNSVEKKEEKKSPANEIGLVSISAGTGLDQLFRDIGVNGIVSGGQTMNPSTEDIVQAIRNCDAKNVYVFPNNSNILMAAYQAADVLVDEINVLVVPSKTIPQGIAAASTYNPDASIDDNFDTMKEALRNVKSGSITYSIKDATINGVEVKKDYFMAIYEKKIISSSKNPIDALYNMIEAMVDEENYLLTVYVGEDINEEQIKKISKELSDKYQELEIDVRVGNQPVYSFLVGVE